MAKSVSQKVLDAAKQGHPPAPDELAALVQIMDDDKIAFLCALYGIMSEKASSAGKLEQQVLELQTVLNQMLAAQARVGIVVETPDEEQEHRALVALDGALVDLPVGVKETLAPGDRVGVVTSAEGAFVARRYGHYAGGTNAAYLGRENGRVLLRGEREEIFRAAIAPTLNLDLLEPGKSTVRTAVFHNGDALALSAVDDNHREGSGLLLEMPGGVTFADLAGMDGTIEAVKSKLLPHFRPELVAAYDLRPGSTATVRRRGIMLAGAPGTGKTELSYAIAAYASEL
jgi:ATP-dependent 26S proteasome regulatory subunit